MISASSGAPGDFKLLSAARNVFLLNCQGHVRRTLSNCRDLAHFLGDDVVAVNLKKRRFFYIACVEAQVKQLW